MAVPQSDKGKALGDALLAFWRAQPSVQGLNLVTLDWDPQMAAQPVHPDNPYTDCPRAFLRMYQDGIRPGPGLGISWSSVKLSLWIQLRQTPGAANQVTLMEAMQAFINPLVGNWKAPAGFMDSPDQATTTVYGFYTENPVVRDETHDPDIDDPALRVSHGEIPINISDVKTYG